MLHGMAHGMAHGTASNKKPNLSSPKASYLAVAHGSMKYVASEIYRLQIVSTTFRSMPTANAKDSGQSEGT